MAYLHRRSMQGVYSPLNFPLPSNSLPMLPAAIAAVKAAANLSVKSNGGRPGMAGAYSRRRQGMGQAAFDPMGWVKENPLLTAGIAIGAVMLLGMGGRRR